MVWELNPLMVALIVLIVWMIITVGGELWQAGGRTGVENLMSNHLVYCLSVASIFLLAAVAYTGWWREVGLQPDGTTSNFMVLIAPGLAVIVIWVVAFRRRLPEGTTLLLAGVNTLLVGFSEEVMFRGILFHATETFFGYAWAVAITAAVFGLMHALNGLITGKPVRAVEQAFLTILFGFWIGAVRLYLSTIYPLIIIHWLWDFGLFAAAPSKTAPADNSPASKIFLLPIAIAIALFAYGLWLLHVYTNRH
jgi:membrane protease YdiL (CAAX protease family)